MVWRYVRFAAVVLMVVAAVVVLRMGIAYLSRQYEYPYGCTHCCLKGIGSALQQYAMENDGHFPAGERCPEASLSLLDKGSNGEYADVLCGKTKSAEAAKAILQRGELLGPDTCDWHDVEGLTLADNSRIAIMWDKVGLGHAGQRLPQGGHSILRLNYEEEVISEADWPQFLNEQKLLLATRTEAAKKGIPALVARARLPNGKIVDHYDAPYRLEEVNRDPSFSNSGDTLDKSVLQRWTLSGSGTMTLTLSFNNWISKPVTVRVSRGRATPNTVLFEMQTQP